MKKDKSKKTNAIIWIIDIIAVCLIIFILYNLIGSSVPGSIKFPWSNYTAKARVVVVRVDEHSMLVQRIEDIKLKDNDLCYLGFTEKGNVGYKMGQELLVYYDGYGYMQMIYPGGFGDVGKIKILKEKSDLEIPIETLRFAYSSKDNVFALVSDFTNTGFTLTILDRNEIPYDYSSSDYGIYTKVKNPNYTGKPGYYDGVPTENSIPAYIAPEPEYIEKDITEYSTEKPELFGYLEKKEIINKESTVKTLTADSQDEISKFKVTRKIINWKELLGELGERKL